MRERSDRSKKRAVDNTITDVYKKSQADFETVGRHSDNHLLTAKSIQNFMIPTKPIENEAEKKQKAKAAKEFIRKLNEEK